MVSTGERQPPGDTLSTGDPYGDEPVRELMEAAKRAWAKGREDIESYEARTWERIYAGLDGERFRRERALFGQERAARVRWEADGERVVRWEGAYREIPVAGRRSDEEEAVAESLAEDLAEAVSPGGPALVEPGARRVEFRALSGPDDEAWGHHPLAEDGAEHYRYHSGDTVEVALPDGSRVTLVEARVEPARSDYRLVAGSLWFDEATGQLARAAYRSARPFNLGLDADDDLPRFLRSVEAEVHTVRIDYGLHEMEWWLPHRYAVTYHIQGGRRFELPVTLEWTFDDYRINQERSAELDPHTVPEDWVRRDHRQPAPGGEAGDEAADSVTAVSLVPPPAELYDPEVLRAPERSRRREITVFADEGLREMRRTLDDLAPRREVYDPRLRWGLEDRLLRYNRVEGLSVGLGGDMPLPRLGRSMSGHAEVRVGTADRHPGGQLWLQRGEGDHQERVGVFRRLLDTSDWNDFLDLSSSVSSLVGGSDRGEYYRADGVEARVVRDRDPLAVRARLFAERHRAAERNTHFHLRGLFNDDTLRANVRAEEGDWYGAEVQLEGHAGVMEGALGEAMDLFGTLGLEAARGHEGWYNRARLSAGLSGAVGVVDGAVEAGVGKAWGHVPVQRGFYLGGPSTLRGVRPGSRAAQEYGFMRTEVGRSWSAFRLAVFGDVAHAAAWEEAYSDATKASAGVGVSFLDGIVRVDLARRLVEGAGWRADFYLDGLF